MAKGSVSVRLTADGEVTILRFEAKAQVAGKLAQIGSRLVDMAAKKMADEFFTNFATQLEPIALAEAPVLEASVEPAPPPMPEFAPAPIPAPVPDALETSSQKGASWIVWAAIGVLVILAVAAYLVVR
jgi:hypothetical protein